MPKLGSAFIASKVHKPNRPTSEELLIDLVFSKYGVAPEYILKTAPGKNSCIIDISVNGELLAAGTGPAINKAKTDAILNALETFKKEQKSPEGWQRSY